MHVPPHLYLMLSGSASTTLTQVTRIKAPLSWEGGLWGGSSMAYTGSVSLMTFTDVSSVGEERSSFEIIIVLPCSSLQFEAFCYLASAVKATYNN